MSDDKSNGKPDMKVRPAPKDIGGELQLFVRQIDALAETLPLAVIAIRRAEDSSGKEFEKFLNEQCEKTYDEREKSTTYTYTVESGQQQQVKRILGRLQKTSAAKELVPRSILVSLVSQFDAFLGRLVRQLFILKPEILNSSANQILFSQLVKFASTLRSCRTACAWMRSYPPEYPSMIRSMRRPRPGWNALKQIRDCLVGQRFLSKPKLP